MRYIWSAFLLCIPSSAFSKKENLKFTPAARVRNMGILYALKNVLMKASGSLKRTQPGSGVHAFRLLGSTDDKPIYETALQAACQLRWLSGTFFKNFSKYWKAGLLKFISRKPICILQPLAESANIIHET